MPTDVTTAGTKPAATGRLAGKVALVTGASRGIGKAVAKLFAREGAELILVARTTGGLEELDDEIRKINGRTSLLVPLDLREFEAIDRLGYALYERYGRLDVLVGNAGDLGTLAPVGHIEPAEWQRIIDINLTANWRLLRSLDPLLRQSEAARAIFVSSSVGSQARPFWGTYSVSKAALEMLVKIYAEEIKQTRIRANIIDPGRTRTGMRAAAYPGEDPQTLPTPDEIAEKFLPLALPDFDGNGQVIKAQ
jgi:NAD(P)-dependent dehydrogenase (short-subunit alcohol dehydrogenase family)